MPGSIFGARVERCIDATLAPGRPEQSMCTGM